jgi:hypothetical protein
MWPEGCEDTMRIAFLMDPLEGEKGALVGEGNRQFRGGDIMGDPRDRLALVRTDR